jgi:ElaB/YqjD/DUF883 family membrane-anchored ribosome-binding protein
LLLLFANYGRYCGCRSNSKKRKKMTTEQANERLTGDLKALMRDAEELMKATAGQAGEKLTEMRSRAAAIESAKTTCYQMEEKTIAAAKVTDRTIRDHPYESIGIAFGVGLLVGVLVGRK